MNDSCNIYATYSFYFANIVTKLERYIIEQKKVTHLPNAPFLKDQ